MRAIRITDEITLAQNAGVACPHCKSHSGHFVYCPLINRNVAEACSTTLTPEDAVRARGLGIIWEEN